MNTTEVSIFSANIFVNATKNSNNNQWNPGHKNKKIWMIYHEIQHWWYFWQNCILFNLAVYLNVNFMTTRITFHPIFHLLTRILKCDFKNYQDYFLIESFRYIMPRKYNSKRKFVCLFFSLQCELFWKICYFFCGEDIITAVFISVTFGWWFM